MAKVSLDIAEKFDQQNNFNSNSNQVSFFSLKNDGEEAIVRFMYNDVSEFEILTCHNVKVNGRDTKISCVRELNESPDKCPLCASGNALSQRFFIKMLQYVNDPSGNVVVKPVVWERSTQYALKLREYLNNYGPLSDIICKVVRHGAAGSMQTNYEIIPNLNKSIYRDDVYVKDTSVISSYSALGRLVKEKTSQDIYTYLQTGQFPETNNSSQGSWGQGNSIPEPTIPYVPSLDPTNNIMQNNNVITTPQVNPEPPFTQPQVVQQTVTPAPGVPPVAPQIPPQTMPWQQNNVSGIQRPIRSY